MSGRENLFWLDLLRVVAALVVVILHVAAEPVVFIRDRDSALWHAANLFDSLSRWSIGVFILVSGGLLLDPARRETLAEFFGKRVQRVLVPLLFWSGVYLGLTVAMGTPLTLEKAATLLWEGRPWYHLWYLFMILGLYAVTPLLRVFVSRAGAPLRWSVVALALALASAWDLKLSLASQMLPGTVATMFIPYLGYYLAGYELRRLAPVRLHPGLLWGGFAIGAACTIVGTHALVSAHGPTRLGLYLYEYLSPNVILMSLAVFCLASRVTRVGAEGGAFARCIIFSAPLTLGIYVAHPMMILGLRKLGLTAIGSQSVMGVLLVALPAFAASLALTWTISRIPLLKRCVGVH